MSKIIALLPMKGHSERVANKNMREFCGRPLYHHVMRSLLESEYIAEIVINTDSGDIAEDARRRFENARRRFENVRILNRPEEICGDFVPMNDIIGYDLSQIQGEHFLQTHSTNPLLTTKTINQAIDQYFKELGQYDSLFSVTRLQTRLYDKKGNPVNHNPEELVRTQDLAPVYEENSNIYIFSKASFKEAGNSRIGARPQMFEIDRLEAVDIDEEVDFKLAEALFNLRKER